MEVVGTACRSGMSCCTLAFDLADQLTVAKGRVHEQLRRICRGMFVSLPHNQLIYREAKVVAPR